MKILKIILNAVKSFLSFLAALPAKLFKNSSIRTKLIAAFMVTVIPIIILGYVSCSLASNSVQSITKQSAQSTVDGANKYLELLFTNVENLSMQLFSDATITKFLDKGINSTDLTSDMYEMLTLRKDAEQKLMGILMNNKAVSDINIISKEKLSLSGGSYNLSEISIDSIRKEKEFEDVVTGGGRTVWRGLHPSLDKKASVRFASYSMTSMRLMKSLTTQNEIGILVIDIKMDIVNKLLEDMNLGKGSEIHLISPDGRDICPQLAPKDGSENKAAESIAEQPFIKTIKTGKDSKGLTDVDYKNSKYLASFNKVGNSNYILVALIPSTTINDSAMKIFKTTLFLVIFAVAIAIGIGLYMATGMGRTIGRIITSAGHAASGDLTVRLTSRRTDELGILTKSINSMIANMRELVEHSSSIAMQVVSSAGTVSTTSSQVSSVSREISRAIEEISQGATAQATDAEQGVLRMSQLADKINTVTDNARSIDTLTKETMQLTEQGLGTIEDLNKKALETTEITKEILVDIQSLDSHSKSIGKIVKVISGIANQTNLLSLNAAIEAARAGEMGKGFAVVADEVRKLAEQSTNATREITDIIKATQQQTAKTVEKAASTDDIIRSQNQAVTNTMEIFKTIMHSMEDLTGQVEQIMSGVIEMDQNKDFALNAIQNISAVSEETAASSEEVTASTQEQLSSIEELASYAQKLGDASKELSDSISSFKLN